MIITKKHALLLARMKDKWNQGLSLDKAVDELTEEDLEYLHHLQLAGLIQEQEDGIFELSQPGHMVGEAIEECLQQTGEIDTWPDNFKFIGSEVISLIEVARLAQGDVSAQPQIASELEKRGMAQDGKLLPVAESILEAYDQALPLIFLTKPLLEGLRKCPPGPGKKSLVPFEKEEVYELEAMRLLVFSLPFGNSYSLTGGGQQIRAALLKGLAPSPVLDDELFTLILKEDLQEDELLKLQAMGAMDDKGQLLPAGRSLYEAAKLLYVSPITLNPAVCLKGRDFEVLEAIETLWDKNKDNPEIIPNNKSVKSFLEDKGITKADTQNSLYVLEGYRLIKAERIEDGVLVYELTDIGKEVREDRKTQGLKSVSASGVMAITTTRMENLSPDDGWVAQAEEEGLVGKAFPTKSGRLFSRLASSIERLPTVDGQQRKVLNVLPFWRGMFLSQILQHLPKMEEKEVVAALERLTGNGIVDVLPGGLYKVTEAGTYFKRAMWIVPEGIEFHVTPHMLRLLAAAAESTENGQINWKEAERKSGLDSEVMEETVLALRKLIYIKSDKITNAGKLLLEGMDILADTRLEWEEIEI
ncbi:MAG: DUF505 domain-containing protein [Thermodesulfobacteria bacterium]|nr:DUF505 domain-containing protein [Thermodesulfobacteriota bacterium]